MARTVPLADGEEVLLRGAMRLRQPGRLPRAVVVRLSRHRLTVLAHYAFQPDRVWELPHGSVRAVQVAGRTVTVSWTSERGPAVLSLSTWTGRRVAPDRPLRDIAAVGGALQAWVATPGGDPTPDLTRRPAT